MFGAGRLSADNALVSSESKSPDAAITVLGETGSMTADPNEELIARDGQDSEHRVDEAKMAKSPQPVELSSIPAVSAEITQIARGRVFIGHGGDNTWREVKDFVVDRLKLEYDEFNREPTAGIHTAEILQKMLEQSTFALIVMTAEDEHGDGKQHARENVVHEAGLFQGRLGFRRAIILLEENCEQFSNIEGLTQIRFPRGKVVIAFEEIRRTLEREGLLAK